jgi:UDP-N-acetylglucosamine 2-epimerase (non-hydrolysing)
MHFGPKRTIVCTIGTRPEAIKMAPLIQGLQAMPWVRCRVLLTGQHRELVNQVLEFFGIEPDINLDVMRLKLPLDRLARHLIDAVSHVLERVRPDMVLAQGDTTSVLAAAMACFHHKLPFAHVEAGLRTHLLFAPFPEEANRVVASHLSAIHFAPTFSARENLEREGVIPERIFVTGNTVIDALLVASRRDIPIGVELDARRRLVLVTAHRRDLFGEPLRLICRAIQQLHDLHPDIEFLWPVHPNPSVEPVVEGLMRTFPRVRLCRPLSYGSFVSAMKRAALILTDSGGVQEEAPALGKPVLVMRSESERPEAIEAGVAKLVGQDPGTIVAETNRLLCDPAAYQLMARGMSPYGDGLAARRIVSIVGEELGAVGWPAMGVRDFETSRSKADRAVNGSNSTGAARARLMKGSSPSNESAGEAAVSP